MNIAFVSSEVFPFAKTGGLADVSAALPKALAKEGCQVKVFMPLYKDIKPQKMQGDFGISRDSGVEFIFIKNDKYFLRDEIYVTEEGVDYPDSLERYSFFSRKVFEVLKKIDFSPDIMHSNDWQASLVNAYLKIIYSKDDFFSKTKSVLTIHNLAYQGISERSKFKLLGIDEKYFDIRYFEFYEKINLLKSGIVFSDRVTTVSPSYAKQIQTPEYGCGLEGVLSEKGRKLTGILNAIDYDIWDPAKDELIYEKYSHQSLKNKAVNKSAFQKELGLEQDQNKMILGVVCRLAEQKGIDILSQALDDILKKHQLVILGVGEPKYHDILKAKADRFKNSFSLNLKFDEALAHKIYAGSDVFLIPSRFEPCGLSQMISYKYATLPLVNHTGGLIDTVVDAKEGGAGFVFNKYCPKALLAAIDEAYEFFKDKDKWQKLLVKSGEYNFSWKHAGDQYIKIYKQIL